jgi:hypothetical protein
MKKAIQKKRGGRRPGSGRPATGNDPVRTFRLSDEFVAKLDAWSSTQEDNPARAEAIRRLVELGLKAEKSRKLVRKPAGAARAAELAAKAIDKMSDPSAPAGERDQRRRRLTKGPPEFRADRVDLPKRRS